jgi:hypothetical protein
MNGTTKVVLVLLLASIVFTGMGIGATDFDTLKKVPFGGSNCVTKVVLEHNMTNIGPEPYLDEWAPSI